ncbi:hypothetical protein Patl1_10501 [Pistacia atlantica]|uniref:Uncharacterized protein n=1 Tax=Pistacia atlantica TaxID=434234 RepID=A0ACC1A057_9ROSI|nr:hypothetical protein Patl1_10501 [Pistacia atlantica]
MFLSFDLQLEFDHVFIHVELDFGIVAETKLFNTYIMPVVQKLYDACKVSFSTHAPISEEALGKVSAILGGTIGTPMEKVLCMVTMTEKDATGVINIRLQSSICTCMNVTDFLKLEAGLMVCSWELIPGLTLQIGIFCMPPSSIIPLHNHPGMTVLTKLLYGSVLVRSYDWLDLPELSDSTQGPLGLKDARTARPAKLVRDCEMTAPCGTTVLYPTSGGNIHSFKALTPCALFDALSPPYCSEDDRNCSYFRLIPRRDLQGTAEVCWLEEIQLPENFVVRSGAYKGPTIRH